MGYDGVGWVMELELELVMEVDGARSKRARVSGSCVVYVFIARSPQINLTVLCLPVTNADMELKSRAWPLKS